MSTAYFYLTGEGEQLARRLAASHPGDLYDKTDFKASLREAFHKYDYLVCIMATGIVVRILAPLLVHKTSDPGVVVMDQRGQYAISLLSGHLGGANDLAREMAALSGGSAVITTATDVAGELSFDTFAKKHGMAIENIGALKHISGALLSGQPVRVITSRTYPELTAAVAAGKMQLMTVEEMRQEQERAEAPDGNTPTGGADRRGANGSDRRRIYAGRSAWRRRVPTQYLGPRPRHRARPLSAAPDHLRRDRLQAEHGRRFHPGRPSCDTKKRGLKPSLPEMYQHHPAESRRTRHPRHRPATRRSPDRHPHRRHRGTGHHRSRYPNLRLRS